MERIIFKQMQSPGDLLMLTVALRDLHLNYPDQFETDVLSCYPEIFFNNRYTTHLPKDGSVKIINMDYGPYLHKLRREGKHFSDCFIYMMNEKLGLDIKKTTARPHIELTEKEKLPSRIKPYILINAGIKSDITLKQYPLRLYQLVIEHIKSQTDKIDVIQVGHSHHMHPILDGIDEDLVGMTDNIRDYFSLVNGAIGCIGAVSFQMHTSAAFGKPCVVIAGGREESSWEKYDNHIYLNTIGKMECCKTEGCWKTTINNCDNFIWDEGISGCMKMIEPNDIIESINSLKLLGI